MKNDTKVRNEFKYGLTLMDKLTEANGNNLTQKTEDFAHHESLVQFT